MNKIDFKNLPDTTTPLSAENLNLLQDNVEAAIPTLDSAVSTSSTNGVENQAITNYVNTKSLEVYSTTETRIGTWTDNKPLYRKVLPITTPNSTSNTQIETFDSTYNIQNYYGKVLIASSQQFLDINFYFSAEYNIATYVIQNTHAINMKVGSNSYTSQDGYIILEYTKTTD